MPSYLMLKPLIELVTIVKLIKNTTEYHEGIYGMTVHYIHILHFIIRKSASYFFMGNRHCAFPNVEKRFRNEYYMNQNRLSPNFLLKIIHNFI